MAPNLQTKTISALLQFSSYTSKLQIGHRSTLRRSSVSDKLIQVDECLLSEFLFLKLPRHSF